MSDSRAAHLARRGRLLSRARRGLSIKSSPSIDSLTAGKFLNSVTAEILFDL